MFKKKAKFREVVVNRKVMTGSRPKRAARKEARKQARISAKTKELNRESARIRGSRGVPGWVWLTLMIIVVVGVGYLLIFSPFFQVKQTILEGAATVSEDEFDQVMTDIMAAKIGLIFPADCIFLISTQKLANDIQGEISRFDQVVIEKKFPSKLIVQVVERDGVLVWNDGRKNYYIDREGIVFTEISLEELMAAGKPVIVDSSGNEVELFEEVVTMSMVEFVQNLVRKFPKETGKEISSLTVPSRRGNEIRLKTTEGWQAYFSVDRTVSEQIDDLATVLNGELQGKINRVEYIDLRVRNWIYYK